MILQNDNTTCSVVSPCSTWGRCSQKCVKLGHYGHKCTCNEGYLLATDHFTCKSIGIIAIHYCIIIIQINYLNILSSFILSDTNIPQIIFSNKHELRGIDLVTRNVKSLISSLKNTVTLDFYHAKDGTDTLYWTDVMDDKIFKGKIIGGCMLKIKYMIDY